MVTEVPTTPEVGEKLEMAGVTLKLVELVAVPPGAVIAMGPVLAPLGTVVFTVVSLTTLKVADVPLNLTEVAPVKPLPVMVTAVPTTPEVGEKPEMVGAVADAGATITRVARPDAAAITPLTNNSRSAAAR